jgi:hypothetical protein
MIHNHRRLSKIICFTESAEELAFHDRRQARGTADTIT